MSAARTLSPSALYRRFASWSRATSRDRPASLAPCPSATHQARCRSRSAAASPARRSALLGVLAQGLQEPVARRRAEGLGDDERLVDQPGDEVEDLRGLDRPAGADGLGPFEREAAGEDGQAAEEGALGRGEQGVGPVDERPERLVAGQGRPAAAGEEAEAVVQARGDLLHAEHAHPRGGELEGEGDAVQTAADLRDVRARSGRSPGRRGRRRRRARRRGPRPRSTGGCGRSAPGRRPARAAPAGPAAGPARRSRRGRRAARGWWRGSRTSGHRCRTAATSRAQASTTCSQLSRRRSARRRPRTAMSAVCAGWPGASPAPIAVSAVPATSAGSARGARGARSTNHTPPGHGQPSGAPAPASTPAAAWSARRVLPTPPAPVSVTSARAASSRRTSASSRPRPTKLVSWRGRLWGGAAGGAGAGAGPRRRAGAASKATRVRRRERQGGRQQGHGLPLRRAADSPLEGADPLRAQARPLGQGLLGQPGARAVATQQLRRTWGPCPRPRSRPRPRPRPSPCSRSVRHSLAPGPGRRPRIAPRPPGAPRARRPRTTGAVRVRCAVVSGSGPRRRADCAPGGGIVQSAP